MTQGKARKSQAGYLDEAGPCPRGASRLQTREPQGAWYLGWLMRRLAPRSPSDVEGQRGMALERSHIKKTLGRTKNVTKLHARDLS